MNSNETNYRSPAVERAFAVLEMAADTTDGVRVMEAAAQLAIPKSTAFVLFAVLERLGYLEKASDGRFQVGRRLVLLATRGNPDHHLVQRCRPVLEELSEQLGLTVHLAALDGDEVVYIDKVESPGLVQFDTFVGKRAPAHLTAVGKALLSTFEGAQLKGILTRADLSGGTGKGPRSIAELETHLEAARKHGFGVENEEEVMGVRCVAAPIATGAGPSRLAVGCIGITSQLTLEQLDAVGARIVEHAVRLGDALASTGTSPLQASGQNVADDR